MGSIICYMIIVADTESVSLRLWSEKKYINIKNLMPLLVLFRSLHTQLKRHIENADPKKKRKRKNVI